jgi:hypothetical protein
MLAATVSAADFVAAALANDSVSSSSSIDSAQWRLAALMFQHKWTDIILSDAIAQVGFVMLGCARACARSYDWITYARVQQIAVSCSEHGMLLGHLRDGISRLVVDFRSLMGDTLAFANSARNHAERVQQLAESEKLRAQVCGDCCDNTVCFLHMASNIGVREKNWRSHKRGTQAM